MLSASIKPIVGLDVDGTVGDYWNHFLQFAEGYLGREMPRLDGETVPTSSLWRFMRVSKSTYRAVKLAYRQGGMKRSMPCYEGARELTLAVRKAGGELWIATTRPYLRLDNIDPDTREWLRRNGIQFDGVLYGEHKYRNLDKATGKRRMVAVLDDLPEMFAQAEELGFYPILRDQPYNRHVDVEPRVYDLSQATAILVPWVKEMRKCA